MRSDVSIENMMLSRNKLSCDENELTVVAPPAAISDGPSIRMPQFFVIGVTVVLALAVHWHLSSRWSANPDEMPNLCAGLAYLTAQDFYHYSVNPPLVKNFAAIPLWLHGVCGPVLGEQPGRPEFASGWGFAEQHPKTGWTGLVAGRRVLFLFTLIGAIGTYRLVSNTLGPIPATLSACFWMTLPPVVGQAPMIQCDIAAAAVGVLAISSFQQWMLKRSWWLAMESAALLGAAILTKYSWIILIYTLVSWTLIDVIRNQRPLREVLRSCGQLFTIHVIALAIIGSAFQFQDWGTALKDGQWRSSAFQALAAAESRHAALSAPARAIASVPVPLPRSVLVGLDIQLGDLQRRLPAFYLGRWHEQGSPIYYPVTLTAKLPVPTMLFALCGVFVCVRQGVAMPLLYAPAIMLVVLVTSTNMNWHVRYAYIILPFVAATAGIGVESCWRLVRSMQPTPEDDVDGSKKRNAWKTRCLRYGGQAVVLGCLGVSLSSALLNPPGSFSYTNRLFGNTSNAGRWVGGSAVDWDHAWIYARRWAESRSLELGQLVTVQHRWTPLSFSGWNLQPLRPQAVAWAAPRYALVPAYQRQKLEHDGWRCFAPQRLEETIVGAIEVYRLESAEVAAGWPELYSLERLQSGPKNSAD